jgi:hypothetical protein
MVLPSRAIAHHGAGGPDLSNEINGVIKLLWLYCAGAGDGSRSSINKVNFRFGTCFKAASAGIRRKTSWPPTTLPANHIRLCPRCLIEFWQAVLDRQALIPFELASAPASRLNAVAS